MKKNFFTFLIVILILLSFITRFYNLNSLPDAFFTDEAALGYNGWSIMTTGKDEYGNFLPLVLRSFDDYKPAVYSYLTIPFIALFGLSQFSSRAPAAFFGALLPVLMYYLVNKLTKNKYLALISAFVMVFTPWHFEISRTAIEAGVALTFTIISLFLFSFQKEYKQLFNKYFILGTVFLILSLFTYHTARLIAPVIILLAGLLKVIQLGKFQKAVIVILMFVGIFLSFFSSSSRFSQISIFSSQESLLLREEAIREDGGLIKVGLFETRMYHNKVLSIIQTFASSYVSNTAFSYLFIGGAQPPRVTIPETGQFLLIFFPFFLLGIFASIRTLTNFDKWILIWLFIAPIPASLTTAEIPHTYRTLFMLPPISIIIANGLLFFHTFASKIKNSKKFPILKFIVVSTLYISIFFNFIKAWHQYAVHQQVHQPWHRQYGYKELVSYLNAIPSAEKITVTNRENEPYMMFLFYNKVDPKIYQANPEKRLGHKEITNGVSSWSMFNYVFSENPCPHDSSDTNSNNYYVVLFTCELPLGYERVKRINFLDGNPEFFVDRPKALNEK